MIVAMASPKLQFGRISQLGAHYAITIITDRRRLLFNSMRLAAIVVDEIRACSRSRLLDPIAWVVMPDHLHLLVGLQEGSLSRLIQGIKSRTAKAINANLGMHGVIWQAGFYDHRLRNDEDLLTQARYIVANPLRRGLVECIDDYPLWWCRWIKCHADL